MDLDGPESEPKGTKRKAEDDVAAPKLPKRIKVRLHPHWRFRLTYLLGA